jgi:hypothetical protein
MKIKMLYLSKDVHQIISSKKELLLLQAYSYHNLQESKLLYMYTVQWPLSDNIIKSF